MNADTAKAVLVTGADGFVGRHLTQELVSGGRTVIGVGRREPRDPIPGISDFRVVDLTKDWPPFPEVGGIVHLAGLAAVGPSFEDPQRYIETNSSMVIRLAQWQSKVGHQARALIISTGAVYDASVGHILDENSATNPSSPYVVSKLLVENLMSYYNRRGSAWVCVRPFNHIGPGQGRGFLAPDLYERVVTATGTTVKTGDLTTRRDYTDVRDVVRAYKLLLEAPHLESRTYNVCSGRSISGHEIFRALTDHLGRDTLMPEIDENQRRPNEVPVIAGSASRLTRELGWRPTRTVQSSIRDFCKWKSQN